MRCVGVLALLLASGLGCSKSGQLDPTKLVRPEGTAMPDGGNDITTPPPSACGDFCGESFLHQIQTPPNLYFLVDRSASMSDIPDGWSLTKYDMARKVLGQLLRVIGHRVRYGASIFPDIIVIDTPQGVVYDDCNGGLEIFAPTVGGLPACDGSFDPTLVSFLTAFGGYAPSGSTPTSAALAKLAPELEALDGDSYLVLLTDGAPNCNDSAKCDVSLCSLNVEGATFRGHACTSDFNCCDADNVGSDGPGYCIDADATKTEITKLKKRGVPTYVVGMPGVGPYAGVLNDLAVAGGTARDGDTAYYAANAESDLETALYAIGTGIAIRCSIDLDAPPDDPAQVNVYFDGELVPSDPDNGWSWDGDTRILVNGDACTRLEAGDVIDARVVFGCDTVVR
jgi:hypothetical protein